MEKTEQACEIVSSKRSFLKWIVTLLGGIALQVTGLFPCTRTSAAQILSQRRKRTEMPSEKLIFISIDALHPKYLELDANGNPGGSDGNRLMPNFQKFIEKSVWFPNAKAFLPAATDMNHLNALAGTSTAQTGIVGVWAQPVGWDENGEVIIKKSHISFAKDNEGNPVDTIYHAWKRRWPMSKTLLITGKEWVGEMFRQPKSESGVDILVTGVKFPEYLKEPHSESFTDPPTDPDKQCDPESKRMGIFGRGGFGPSDVLTRLYTGQRSLLTLQMEHFANHFPNDAWIVDSTLEIFKREDPDMAYILLAQCDDAGHCIGNAWDPTEFEIKEEAYKTPRNCKNKTEYQLISTRNRLLYKEAILDVIRDIDFHFGRLINGLEKQGVMQNARVVLLSDHSAVNHLYSDDFSSTDFMALLKDADLVIDDNIYAFSVSSYGVLYWRDNRGQIAHAKEILTAHRTINLQTGKSECPWWVLDRNDMKFGVKGVSLPGELYHQYYIEVNRERDMIWPDLIVLGKNGWQIPVYNGHIPNVGIKAPSWTPPFRVYNGGHGSVDTLPIMAAIYNPNGRTGIDKRTIRIADLGVTAASLFGLKLKSNTIGKDLSQDLLMRS